MCDACTHTAQLRKPATIGGMMVYASTKADPTRTTMLRASFEKDITKRFRTLATLITQAVVDRDVFGLESPTVFSKVLQTNALPTERAFVFSRSQDKINAFMDWLDTQIKSGILSISEGKQLGQAVETAWTNMYIQDSYKRGVVRGRYELNKAGYNVPTMAQTGGINTSMMMPFHADRLGLLYTRTFQELKGITSAMDSQISRVLTQGIADGDGPRLLASKMGAVIKGGGAELGITDTLGRFIPAERRAATLARTEIIRAHHAATIQEYRNYGAEGVNVQAEWSTAGFDVCAECAELQGQIFTLDEIEGMIPVHPNCRCLALPYLPEGVDIPEGAAEVVEAAAEGGLVKDLTSPDFPDNTDVLDIIEKDATRTLGTSMGYEDLWLKEIANKQGFDALPQVVDADEFERIPGYTIFRGTKEGSKYVEQFIEGEYFGGTGATGNGYYFAMADKNLNDAFATAKAYAGGNSEGVLTAKIVKDAKIIEWKDLSEAVLKYEEDNLKFSSLKRYLKDGVLNDDELDKIRRLFSEPGKFGALKGYDAIRIPAPFDNDYLVVLNRGKIIVKKVE